MTTQQLDVASKLHAERIQDFCVFYNVCPMSKMEAAKEQLEFKRQLKRRLSCFEHVPDPLPSERGIAGDAILSAYYLAVRDVQRGCEPSMIALHFRDAVREALQPKLF